MIAIYTQLFITIYVPYAKYYENHILVKLIMISLGHVCHGWFIIAYHNKMQKRERKKKRGNLTKVINPFLYSRNTASRPAKTILPHTIAMVFGHLVCEHTCAWHKQVEDKAD